MCPKPYFPKKTVLAACLLLHGTACTWTTGFGEKRRTYILGFGVVARPMHGGQEPSRVWVQEMRGVGIGVTQGAGPSHVYCGAFASHETALPTGWEGVVVYKKDPRPTTQSPKTP